jgi:hypothetical protein
MDKKDNQERKLRTRTLIQCGGLLKLSGLLEQCSITEGEDLQYDIESYEKSAVLLGILMDASERFLQDHSFEAIEDFRQAGTTKMRQTAARYE